MLSIGDAGPGGLVALLAAAVAAGVINAVVGSGSLFTFPTLLALGVPALPANVSNNLGLVPGNATAAWGYRDRLAGQRRRLAALVPASLVGGGVGAGLLLVLPGSVFDRVVPWLIGIAVVLVLVQPRLQARLRSRQAARAAAGVPATAGVPVLLVLGAGLAGVYGGYFGAAQGVLLIGLLGALLDEDLQRLNAVKNTLALAVNLVAAVVFLTAAPDRIRWAAVLVVAVGSSLGGLLGARLGKRLPPVVFRVVIAVVGVVAIVALLR